MTYFQDRMCAHVRMVTPTMDLVHASILMNVSMLMHVVEMALESVSIWYPTTAAHVDTVMREILVKLNLPMVSKLSACLIPVICMTPHTR